MTALITNISAQRSSDLRRYAAERRRALRGRRGRPGRTTAQDVSGRVEIRALDASGADRASLARLASLDSGIVPTGASLGAELTAAWSPPCRSTAASLSPIRSPPPPTSAPCSSSAPRSCAPPSATSVPFRGARLAFGMDESREQPEPARPAGH